MKPGATPLNPQQLAAVNHDRGALLVLAGAGSGKTRVITHRIARLISEVGVPPEEILAVTFTNKAAGEMKERLAKMLGAKGHRLWVGTFHSICLMLLRQSADRLGYSKNFVIYDANDSLSLVRDCLTDLQIDEKRFHPKAVDARIDAAKNSLIWPEAYAADATDFYASKVALVYTLYQKRLKDYNAMDFGDLIGLAVKLFEIAPSVLAHYQARFRHLLVDEYQDTNHAQYRLVRLLSPSGENLCVVGDEDQCLVGDTLITMGDGVKRSIGKVQTNDLVLSCYGSGSFRPARVTRVFSSHHRGEGILIRMRSGKQLVSTPEHTHFAGYRLGCVPQVYFSYLMFKRGVGWRLGTTQVYTAGQQKPMVGFTRRLLQEHADALWIIGTHRSENEARADEYITSLKYQIPTLPFVPRKGRSHNGLVHDPEYLTRVFGSFDTETSARKLIADRGLSIDYPHHRPRSRNASRRNVVVTLCGDHRGLSPMHRISMVGNDEPGRTQLEVHGFSVRPAKQGSKSWRFETAHKDFVRINQIVEKLRQLFDINVFLTARLGANAEEALEGNSLSFLPAASVMSGMAMFSEDGRYDIVEEVKRVRLDETVYDLNIESTHNFIANGIVTHNSIYRWRGADLNNVLNFERDFPGAQVIKLEQNYRSTQTIVEAATALISHNTLRKGKKLWSDAPRGEPIAKLEARHEKEEAAWIVGNLLHIKNKSGCRWQDQAIFYRTNAQSRLFEDELRRFKIPYRVFGGVRFYDRLEIKDLLAYLKFLANEQDNLSLKRAVASPARGIGKTSMEKMELWAGEHGATLWQAMESELCMKNLGAGVAKKVQMLVRLIERLQKEKDKQPLPAFIQSVLELSGYLGDLKRQGTSEAEDRQENLGEFINMAAEFSQAEPEATLATFLDRLALVQDSDSYNPEEGAVSLMTVHVAKGLEFPYVFVAGLEEGLFPHSRSAEDPEELEEERRLMYVAMTRAKLRLFLSSSMVRKQFGSERYNIPSRFLDEIPANFFQPPANPAVRNAARSPRETRIVWDE